MGRGRGIIVSDDDILSAYQETGSVWKAGEKLGIVGQTVHARLSKMGKNVGHNVFTPEHDAELILSYTLYASSGRLAELAKKMGRTKQFLCRQAKRLGLTDIKRDRPWMTKHATNTYMHNHHVVRRTLGQPKKCTVCGTDEDKVWYEWANLTGDYANPDDYKRMCRKCHRTYDKTRPPSKAHL